MRRTARAPPPPLRGGRAALSNRPHTCVAVPCAHRTAAIADSGLAAQEDDECRVALALTDRLVWQDLDETLEEVALDTELEVAQAAAAEPSASGQAAADTDSGDPALAAHARRLGVDLASEAYLLPVLREGYGAALPAGWAQEPAGEAAGGHVVYYNRRTGARTEEHPNDRRTRRRIEAYRRGRRHDQASTRGTDGPPVSEAFCFH
jgi:hypothetical protein